MKSGYSRAHRRYAEAMIDALALVPMKTLPGWPEELDRITVRGGGGFCEVALFHRPGRALILVDLVQNFEPGKLPLPLRPFARAAGSTKASAEPSAATSTTSSHDDGTSVGWSATTVAKVW